MVDRNYGLDEKNSKLDVFEGLGGGNAMISWTNFKPPKGACMRKMLGGPPFSAPNLPRCGISADSQNVLK